MSKKNGKIKGQVITGRDPLAREFRAPRDPFQVHNERLARNMRARDRDRAKANQPLSDAELIILGREWIEAVRKHHPSTLSNFPASADASNEIKLKYDGVEIRLGIVDDPEDQDND